jgi:hypothetical protein
MWKRSVVKIGGSILFVWAVLRWPVDTVESARAIGRYLEYLHCYAPFLFTPSNFFTIGLFLVGAALIFSDQLSDFVTTHWPRNSNIELRQILRSGISWDNTNACYVHIPDTQRPTWAIFLELANEVELGKPSPTAGRIKAQITYHFKNGPDLRAAPGAWMDEPLSSVELACGDTRWLIVAVSSHYTQDWRVPFNRRSDIKNPPSFEHYKIPGLLGTSGTAEVQLISMEANKVLLTLFFNWQWLPGYSLELTYLKQTRDS